MGFEKGKPRPANAGRKKGTPNKVHTFLHAVKVESIEDLKQKYPDPLLRLLQIGNDPNTPVAIQVHCHKEVAKYLHAQKREVEHVNKLTLEDLVMQSYQKVNKESEPKE